MNTQITSPKSEGFALIEALIVTSVFVVGFVAASKIEVNMIKEKQIASQENQAMRVSNQKVEQIRNYTDLASYTGIAGSSGSSNAANTAYTNTVTVTTLTKHKKLDQTVSWTNSTGENKSLTVSNYISQNNPQYSGLLFSTSFNSTPLPAPGGSFSNSTPSSGGGSPSTATRDETVPGTSIVLTYDVNNKVIEINHEAAVSFTGSITYDTGASAPPSSVDINNVILNPQTTNSKAITCSYSGPTGYLNCYMARGWSGFIYLNGITQTNVCVSNQQPYTNLLVSVSSQSYVLTKLTSLCPARVNFLLQTL
jgi:Tfp pilus assembly protein PilV